MYKLKVRESSAPEPCFSFPIDSGNIEYQGHLSLCFFLFHFCLIHARAGPRFRPCHRTPANLLSAKPKYFKSGSSCMSSTTEVFQLLRSSKVFEPIAIAAAETKGKTAADAKCDLLACGETEQKRFSLSYRTRQWPVGRECKLSAVSRGRSPS